MAPDPRSRETESGIHKIPLDLQFNVTPGNKLNGNVTPIEEKMVQSGIMSKVTQNGLHGEIPGQTSDANTQTTMNEPLVSVQHRDGPEQILPTEEIVTWVNDKPVKMKLGNKGISSYKPISIPGMLKKTAAEYPTMNALASKDSSGTWQFVNYAQYLKDVRTVAKAFIKLGLERFHSVCIIGFNSKEWLYSNLGAIFAGGFAAGIYTTNSPEACLHCAKDCRAQIFVVENQKQLDKILKIQKDLPLLKTIIQYSGKPTVKGVLSWDDIMEMGRAEKDDELEDRLSRIAINQCSSLIYTSGTTGQPKGVMLSHDNLTWTAKATNLCLGTIIGEIMISYLPLSHVAAQICDIYCIIQAPGTLYFADADALKGSLGDFLKDIRPTTFLGVPRVFEKIYEKMQEVGKKTTGLKRSIAIWAKSVGLEKSYRRQNNVLEKPFGFTMANTLVFKKVKEALGFDRCKVFMSVGAPLSLEIEEYFHSLNIPVCPIYGMSESTAPHSVAFRKCFKFTSVGKTLHGCYTKIDNPDDEGNGEICMGGRHVFMGYLNMMEKTLDTVDPEGFLHSGDIGKLDEEGFLYITGRLKELIITAGGENVPPVLIEDELKRNLPCVSNAMLIGDQRKFLSILLTLKTEVDEELRPLDELTPACLEWLQDTGSKAKTVTEIISTPPNDIVMRKIQQGIDKTNSNATSNAQKIQKWTILPKDFSVTTGELGPTLKLKRQEVLKKYSDTIDKFYV